MRGFFTLFLVACSREQEPVQGVCNGTKLTDREDDGIVDERAAIRVDEQNRTIYESWVEEGYGLVEQRLVYDETGLVEHTYLRDGIEQMKIWWERRTDGQPLREESWSAEGVTPDMSGVITYEYEGDKLSREVRGPYVTEHHYDEHGRDGSRETFTDGQLSATVEHWYNEPAPSLDGGFRTDQPVDGVFEVEMERWYDGDLLVAQEGESRGLSSVGSWRYGEQGELLASSVLLGDQLQETEKSYDERGLPVLSVTVTDYAPDNELGFTDHTTRVTWDWRCEGEAP